MSDAWVETSCSIHPPPFLSSSLLPSFLMCLVHTGSYVFVKGANKRKVSKHTEAVVTNQHRFGKQGHAPPSPTMCFWVNC